MKICTIATHHNQTTRRHITTTATPIVTRKGSLVIWIATTLSSISRIHPISASFITTHYNPIQQQRKISGTSTAAIHSSFHKHKLPHLRPLSFSTRSTTSSSHWDHSFRKGLFPFQQHSMHRMHHFSSTTMKSTSSSSSSSCSSLPANDPTANTRVALLQFKVTDDKQQNHATAMEYLQRAHAQGASLAVLPEIWNSPYATTAFGDYAEPLPDLYYQYQVQADCDSSSSSLDSSPSAKLLFQAATQYQMYIIGGSIPEVDENSHIYNTCLCISPSGKLIGKHRKVHLFDIDVPGGIRFMESDTLSPGNSLTAFSAGSFGNIGVGICYDIRFPEYALLLHQKYQCNLLVYPGAFNMTTGAAHWELLQRARAVDNQCFVLTASPARVEEGEEGVQGISKYKHYTAWGHSTVVNPWGEVIGTCGEEESLVVVDLDMDRVKSMREGIPTMRQKRHDLYQLLDGKDSA